MAKVAGNEKLLLAMVFVGIVGFGTKAGLYPMHGWLPAAHPIAPAPASALLSGIIAKAGIIAIIRLVYFSVGADFIRGTWVQYTWMTLCMLTIFMGSMMAYKEKVTKKRLAYSTISQISYINLGLALLTPEGAVGGLLHVAAHATSKGCLFLAAGVFIYKLGKRNVSELRGIGKQLPITMWCFLIASLSGGNSAYGWICEQMVHRSRRCRRRHGNLLDSSAGHFADLSFADSRLSAAGRDRCILPGA